VAQASSGSAARSKPAVELRVTVPFQQGTKGPTRASLIQTLTTLADLPDGDIVEARIVGDPKTSLWEPNKPRPHKAGSGAPPPPPPGPSGPSAAATASAGAPEGAAGVDEPAATATAIGKVTKTDPKAVWLYQTYKVDATDKGVLHRLRSAVATAAGEQHRGITISIWMDRDQLQQHKLREQRMAVLQARHTADPSKEPEVRWQGGRLGGPEIKVNGSWEKAPMVDTKQKEQQPSGTPDGDGHNADKP
jgi:hypothetical protein